MTRVHLELLVTDLPEAVGGKRLEVEFEGETVADLVSHLQKRYGQAARDALLDEEGLLDPVIQFVVNKEAWVRHDQLDRPLHDGDNVTILALLAGG